MSVPASAPAPASHGHRLPRGRRYAVRSLLGLAAVLWVVAIAAVWANRQALDADHWADTSSAMLDDPLIRTQVAASLVDAVYANVDVRAELARGLPPRLEPLAGPAAGALRGLGQRTTEAALGRPRVQRAWEEANRLTAQQFINVAEGRSSAVTSSGDAVVLDLRVLVLDLVARLGLPPSLETKIPAGTGQIKIMSGSQVSAVKDGVSALQGLATVLPALAIALLALAVGLARGRRRETLLEAGVVLVATGVLVLVVRRLVGAQVVDSLAASDSVRPATEHAWSIATRMLRDIAQASVIAGIPVVLAAWLAGPMRSATSLRRLAAPGLREHPGAAYGILAALLLLVVAWGPIPATRSPLPVLLMVVLAVAGLAVLRRQTAEEFPPAGSGSGDGPGPTPPSPPANDAAPRTPALTGGQAS